MKPEEVMHYVLQRRETMKEIPRRSPKCWFRAEDFDHDTGEQLRISVFEIGHGCSDTRMSLRRSTGKPGCWATSGKTDITIHNTADIERSLRWLYEYSKNHKKIVDHIILRHPVGIYEVYRGEWPLGEKQFEIRWNEDKDWITRRIKLSTAGMITAHREHAGLLQKESKQIEYDCYLNESLERIDTLLDWLFEAREDMEED